MYKFNLSVLSLSCLLAWQWPAIAVAQEEKTDAKVSEGKTENGDKKKSVKDLDQFVGKMTKHDGLLPLYRNDTTGELYLEVTASRLNNRLLLTGQVTNGLASAGVGRGGYDKVRVVRFKKHFNNIELVQENTRYHFDPSKAISKAQDANMSDAILSYEKIVAQDKDQTRFLISADNLFKTEKIAKLKNNPKKGFQLGNLSKEKTRITKIRNYPENLALETAFSYDKPEVDNLGDLDVTDARYITLSYQFDLMALPDNGYEPRLDDPRVGFFALQQNDVTSEYYLPYRDYIQRWNLVKKDPKAVLSEPVKPITYWMSNTTPLELRDTIKSAVESWNDAFEGAGFKNAVVVKQQPDDADWDAGDIRYNVLQWAASPKPGFAGYGPSHSNPLTGEIFAADIQLEYSFLLNRIQGDRLWGQQQAATEHSELQALTAHEEHCALAAELQLSQNLGQVLAASHNLNDTANQELLRQAVSYLVLHETGHTLGLMHNMKATAATPYVDMYNPAKQANGIASSVMDYPSINFAPEGKSQGAYYITKPGVYDKWAIKFGYTPELSDQVKREAHLQLSTLPGHDFGNDSDDMRSPGKGIDPRANTNDMSDDSIAYALDRIAVNNNAIAKLKQKFVKPGEGYQQLRWAFQTLLKSNFVQAGIISRWIGGVYVNRSVVGQPNAKTPYLPVEYERQQQAMQSLIKHVFAPDAFQFAPELLQYLAIERRGFNQQKEDPRPHAIVIQGQKSVLAHLLHANTLGRMVDSALYGNQYTVNKMFEDLTGGIFKADLSGKVNTFRQQLQVYYVEQLLQLVTDTNQLTIVNAAAIYNLRKIEDWMKQHAQTEPAHRLRLVQLINQALDAGATVAKKGR